MATLTAFLCSVAGEGIAQTVIEVPPQFSPSDVSGNIVVNLRDGGTLPRTTVFRSGSQLNIYGGGGRTVITREGGSIDMIGGEVRSLVSQIDGFVRVAGGVVSGQVQVSPGGEASIVGGFSEIIYGMGGTTAIEGGVFKTLAGEAGATIDMSGYGFRLNGAPVPGLSGVGDSSGLDLVRGDVLTGFLASGAPFAVLNQIASSTNLRDATFTLHQSAEVPQGSETFVLPGDTAPAYVGPGQTLRVKESGDVPENFRAGRGSTVVVDGGNVRNGIQAIGAMVRLSDGQITRLQLIDGATLDLTGTGRLSGITDILSGASANIRGGETGEIRVYPDGTSTVTGGMVSSMQPQSGSTFLQTGGIIGNLDISGDGRFDGGQYNNLRIAPDGTATLAGGRNGQYLKVQSGSELTFEGAEFLLDGVPLGSGAVLPAGTNFEQLTGVLADGTAFAYSPLNFSEFGGVLRFTETALPAIGPASIVVDGAASPNGIRRGQVLTVEDGGVLPDGFNAGSGSRLVVNGGRVGRNVKATDAVVEINGGDIDTQLAAFHGTQMTISGDANYGWVKVLPDASLTISGGTGGGAWIDLFPGTSLTMTDGVVRQTIAARSAEVTISGGEFATGTGHVLNLREGSVATVSGGSGGGISVRDSSLLMTGGSIKMLQPQGDSTILVSDGSVDTLLIDTDVATNSLTATFSGGDLNEIYLNGGQTLLSGGSIGDRINLNSGRIELRGYAFQINGISVSGVATPGQSRLVDIPENAVFTGVLADGTPFIINMRDEATPATIGDGVLRLTQTVEASLPDEVVVDSDTAPHGIAGTRRLMLVEGGRLGRNFVAGPGSTVEIQGGFVGSNFEVDRAEVSISGGVISDEMDIFSGGLVAMTGGTVARGLQVHQGGRLNLSGGELSYQTDVSGLIKMTGGIVQSGLSILGGGSAQVSGGRVVDLNAESASTVEILGGSIRSFDGQSGSVTSMSGGLIENSASIDAGAKFYQGGGSLGENFLVFPNADFEALGGSLGPAFSVVPSAEAKLTGYDFRVDGVPISEMQDPGDSLHFQVSDGSLFTGKLADGTPFFIKGSSTYTGAFRLTTAETPPVTGNLTIDTDQSGPGSVFGVGDGRILTLNEGGSLLQWFSVSSGAKLIANGGSIGAGLMTRDATIEVNAGVLGGLRDYGDTTLLVNGGAVEGSLRLQNGSSLQMSDGAANFVEARSGVDIVVDGGSIDELAAQSGSSVRVRGGVVGVEPGTGITSLSGSVVNIEGGELLGSITAFGGALVISGGTIDAAVQVAGTSTLDILATEFAYDGRPIEGLTTIGDSLLFPNRGGLLTAILQDGTPFSLYLNGTEPGRWTDFSYDVVSFQASLRLQLVGVIPEPSSFALIGFCIAIVGQARPPRLRMNLKR